MLIPRTVTQTSVLPSSRVRISSTATTAASTADAAASPPPSVTAPTRKSGSVARRPAVPVGIGRRTAAFRSGCRDIAATRFRRAGGRLVGRGLQVEEACVLPAERHQLVMGALLADLPAGKDDDVVRVLHGAEP